MATETHYRKPPRLRQTKRRIENFSSSARKFQPKARLATAPDETGRNRRRRIVMTAMPIIEVNHVTKEYQLGQLQSLKTTVFNQWRRLTGQPVEERAPFKALDDVNFSIEPGEVVGIIGHNDADKSKMLKLLAKTSKSMSDTIKLKMTPHV